MEEGHIKSYQVRVLHLKNPYLIWIQVLQPPNPDGENYNFEQVGLYGVTPLTTEANYLSESTLVLKKHPKWLPGVTVFLYECFDDAAEVWFQPLHIENRSSIFDDGCHKFGDFTILKNNGKVFKLSHKVETCKLIQYSESDFLNYLTKGLINTKLNEEQTLEAFKGIKDSLKSIKAADVCWETSIKRQTKLLDMKHETMEKIKKYLYVKAKMSIEKRTLSPEEQSRIIAETAKTIDGKERDLEQVKYAYHDDKSLGRGSSRKSSSRSSDHELELKSGHDSVVSGASYLAKFKHFKANEERMKREQRELQKEFENEHINNTKDYVEAYKKYYAHQGAIPKDISKSSSSDDPEKVQQHNKISSNTRNSAKHFNSRLHEDSVRSQYRQKIDNKPVIDDGVKKTKRTEAENEVAAQREAKSCHNSRSQPYSREHQRYKKSPQHHYSENFQKSQPSERHERHHSYNNALRTETDDKVQYYRSDTTKKYRQLHPIGDHEDTEYTGDHNGRHHQPLSKQIRDAKQSPKNLNSSQNSNGDAYAMTEDSEYYAEYSKLMEKFERATKLKKSNEKQIHTVHNASRISKNLEDSSSIKSTNINTPINQTHQYKSWLENQEEDALNVKEHCKEVPMDKMKYKDQQLGHMVGQEDRMYKAENDVSIESEEFINKCKQGNVLQNISTPNKSFKDESFRDAVNHNETDKNKGEIRFYNHSNEPPYERHENKHNISKSKSSNTHQNDFRYSEDKENQSYEQRNQYKNSGEIISTRSTDLTDSPKKKGRKDIPALHNNENLVAVGPAGMKIDQIKIVKVTQSYKPTPKKLVLIQSDKTSSERKEMKETTWQGVDSDVNFPIHLKTKDMRHEVCRESQIDEFEDENIHSNSTIENRSCTDVDTKININKNRLDVIDTVDNRYVVLDDRHVDNKANNVKKQVMEPSENILYKKTDSSKFDSDVVPRDVIENDNLDDYDNIFIDRSISKNRNCHNYDKRIYTANRKFQEKKNSDYSSGNSSLSNHNKKNLTKTSFSTTSSSNSVDTTAKDSNSTTDCSPVSKFKTNDVSSSSDTNKTYDIVEKPLKTIQNIRNLPKTNYESKPAISFEPMPEFVQNFVTPKLMIHSKTVKKIKPALQMSDVNFNHHIHQTLTDMNIRKPTQIQTVSWSVILRGHSCFLISPMQSGKTVGYIPAVCRLVSDEEKADGPICIIICATANSVDDVAAKCRRLLHQKTVHAAYAGIDEKKLIHNINNSCDVLVTTPCALIRLFQLEHQCLNLANVLTVVFDDCERLERAYLGELGQFMKRIKRMLKYRVNKELQVQFIVASRVWCEFMNPLVKKVPNAVVCIGAYQECMVYSKCDVSVNLILKEDKIDMLFEFLKTIDNSKRTAVICCTDDEVKHVSKSLTAANFIVFSADSKVGIEGMRSLYVEWNKYNEPFIGPLLVCLDENLNHINATDCSYLIHYSLPNKFSTFNNRFAILGDNYPSIFEPDANSPRIKILLDENNKQQLPKLLHLIERCTKNIPQSAKNLVDDVTEQKDRIKAETFIPVCDNLLSFGECIDYWYCRRRHTLFPDIDKSQDWLPKDGIINFKIRVYHTASHYSATLISHQATNGEKKKIPQTYNSVNLKLNMYFTQDSHKKTHGVPKAGDICAVALKLNFYERCKVIKVLSYNNNGLPDSILVNMIDDERLEVVKDYHLFHLPKDIRDIPAYTIHVRLSVSPRDKDVSFSNLARDHMMHLMKNCGELYMRAKVVLTIGNSVIVDNLEACEDLKAVGGTAVRYHFLEELCKSHAIPNPEHVSKLKELCSKSCLLREIEQPEHVKNKKEIKLPDPQWAHLEENEYSLCYLSSVESPDLFFVKLLKFVDCLNKLTKDINEYVERVDAGKHVFKEGDIVIALFPDDNTYNRARIENITDNVKPEAKCFFVDHGDFRIIKLNNIYPINENLITSLPFQAIECRLIGLKPIDNEWSDVASNLFFDQCIESNGDLKELHIKYLKKERANVTDGNKYSVLIIDTTSSSEDIIINRLLVELKVAQINHNEVDQIKTIDFSRPTEPNSDDDFSDPETNIRDNSSLVATKAKEAMPLTKANLKELAKNITDFDIDSDSDRSWDVEFSPDVVGELIKTMKPSSTNVKVTEIDDANNYKITTIKDFTAHSPIEAVEKIEGRGLSSLSDKSNADNDSFSQMEYVQTPELDEIESITTPENQESNRRNETFSRDGIKIEGKALKDSSQSCKPSAFSAYSQNHGYMRNLDIKKLSITLNDGGISEDSFRQNNLEMCESPELVQELDSDDLSSPETELKSIKFKPIEMMDKFSPKIKEISARLIRNNEAITEICPTIKLEENNKLKHDNINIESAFIEPETSDHIKNIDKILHKVANVENVTKKPTVVWRQTAMHIYLKINILELEKYDIDIQRTHIEFSAIANDVRYHFKIEFFGRIYPENCSHEYKGLYVLVRLEKMARSIWQGLTAEEEEKFIKYDLENIEASDDESEIDNHEAKSELKKLITSFSDSEIDEEDFVNVCDDSVGVNKYY